ncbi:MAG: cadherin repeat domain-containing protein [Lysobacterales bacterium]|nr:MAG: cadherin repeat domain-containing protein [Xanthomonadales bacterium]
MRLINQFLSIGENSAAGTVVGTLAASDPNVADTLSYSIAGGNIGGAFSISAGTGQVLVANPAMPDYAGNPGFTLTVQVTDSGAPALSDTAIVTIQLNDLAEAVTPPPPVSAAENNEAPATEVEIAVEAMVSKEEGFQQELDKVQDEISELAKIESTVVGSSAVVTTGLSVGYVVRLARGGMLLASLLSSMPAWRAIDPLPVLANFRDNAEDDADDESLGSLLRKGGANKAAKLAEAEAAAIPEHVEPDLPLDDGATA